VRDGTQDRGRSPGAASAGAIEEIGEAHAATFEDLVGTELTALHLRALRLTHDNEAAQDLVQDTLERAYRKFSRFRPGSNIRAWLLCIMRNIWISDYRRQARAPRTVPLDEIDETLPCFDGGDATSASDVESSVVDELSVASIHMAIDRLPSQIRQVVVLADVEDTPYGIIAEALAIPIGTVASRLFRGRRQLQRALRDQARGAGDLAKAG
jgi:RNA polymerase sigma-70 factor (ECF subfamily)